MSDFDWIWSHKSEDLKLILVIKSNLNSSKYSQIQQTLAKPHFPIGTPPNLRHVNIEAQFPSICDVVGDPGIIDVIVHGGPVM